MSVTYEISEREFPKGKHNIVVLRKNITNEFYQTIQEPSGVNWLSYSSSEDKIFCIHTMHIIWQ